MSGNERGLQNKQDSLFNQADNGDFPILCEGCLGDTPYVRMQKMTLAGQCKMCDRPFTVFKWRPGRGEGYRKTEVCQVCAKVKNLCQTCILDLQFGLPSQLRDAVLASDGSGVAPPESDVHREYHAQQHLALLNSGQDPWQDTNTPNEQLLKIAREATQNREHARVKMPNQGVKRERSDMEKEAEEAQAEPAGCCAASVHCLPPGVTDPTKIASQVPEGFKAFASVSSAGGMAGDFFPSPQFTGVRPGYFFGLGHFGLGYYIDVRGDPKLLEAARSVGKGGAKSDGSNSGGVKRRPPPKGPPPKWALEGKSVAPTVSS